MKRRVLGAVTLLMMLLAFLAAPLAAQTDGEATTTDTTNTASFEVLRVDLRTDGGLVAVRPERGAEPGEMTVVIEGEEVPANLTPIHRSSIDVYTIIVIDDSETADSVAGFSRIQQAALAYVAGVGADTRLMLVRAGGGRLEIRPEVAFTSNHASIRSAIERLRPTGGAVTWDAIADSVVAFNRQGEGLRNVVAFIGSPGLNSRQNAAIAKGNLLSANSSFTVVAPEAANLAIAPFADVANSVRGGALFRGTASADMVVAARAAAQTHESYLVGRFDASSVIPIPTQAVGDGPSPTNEITVNYGEQSERVRVVPNGVAQGSSLAAPPIPETSRFAILRGNNGAMIAIALAVVATLLFSFTMLQIFLGNDNSLNSTLSVYGPQDRTEEQHAAGDAFQSHRSKIIEQVVERAEEAAASRGNLTSTTTLLEKAEIPLRVGEAFAIQVGIILAALLVGFLLSGGNPFVALAFGVPAGIFPSFFVKFKVRRRAKKLERQLPDTLNLLASTLKAGYSFIQGIDAVGNEAEEPLAGEFRRTVNEARLGKDMDEALDDLAERVDSVDLLWAIVAIKIQREVGGNLAELLSTVADTMTSRSRLRGEVSALTAEGRMSALVLLFLPFGVGLAMYFMNKKYISTLWESSMGYAAMGAGAVSMVVGALWMRKIIDIEI
jgi:tight adherence protein B